MPEFDGLWSEEESEPEAMEEDVPVKKILSVTLSEYEIAYLESTILERKKMIAEDHEWTSGDGGKLISKDGHIEISQDGTSVFYIFRDTLIPLLETDIEKGTNDTANHCAVILSDVTLNIEDFQCIYVQTMMKTIYDFPECRCTNPKNDGKFCQGFSVSCPLRVRKDKVVIE